MSHRRWLNARKIKYRDDRQYEVRITPQLAMIMEIVIIIIIRTTTSGGIKVCPSKACPDPMMDSRMRLNGINGFGALKGCYYNPPSLVFVRVLVQH